MKPLNPELDKEWPDMVPVKLPILPPDLQGRAPTAEELDAGRRGYTSEMRRGLEIAAAEIRARRSIARNVAAILALTAVLLILYTVASYVHLWHV